MADERTVTPDEDIPILIDSDDESDDDVVIIKEEIDIDNDDVIFLSETKPPEVDLKPPDKASLLLEDSTSRCTSVNNGFNRSASISTLTTGLNLGDDSAEDNPLDLSSNVSLYGSHLLNGDAGSDDVTNPLPPTMCFQSLTCSQQTSTCNANDSVLKLPVFDPASKDDKTTGTGDHTPSQQVVGGTDGGLQQQCSDSVPGQQTSAACSQLNGAQGCVPDSGTVQTDSDVSLTMDQGPSVSSGCPTDINHEQMPAAGQGLSKTSLTSSPITCISHTSDLNVHNLDSQRHHTPDSDSQFCNNAVIDKQNNLPVSHDSILTDITNKPDAINTANQPSVPAVFKPSPLMYDLSPPPSFSMAPSVITISPPALTSASPTKSINTNNSFGTPATYSVDSTKQMAATNLPLVMPTAADAHNCDISVDSQANSAVVTQSAVVPMANTDSYNDQFSGTHVPLLSRDPMWSINTLGNVQNSSLLSANTNDQSVLSVDTGRHSASQSVSSLNLLSQSIPNLTDHSLAGGYQPNTYQQTSITDSNAYGTCSSSLDILSSGPFDTQSTTTSVASNNQIKNSCDALSVFTSICNPQTDNQGVPGDTNAVFNPLKRSLSYDQPMYILYNQLTLPKYMHPLQHKPDALSMLPVSSEATSTKSVKDLQNQRLYKRSFSNSSVCDAGTSSSNTSGLSQTNVTSGPEQSQSQGLHQLPPKKQKRCFQVDSCAQCLQTLTFMKFSRCPVGHGACSSCLEERVKSVLTGKTKGSVKCLNIQCDSFYPISELKLSLPSMVVEILEDKLDNDYIEFVSNMMIGNVSNDETEGPEPGSLEGACGETVEPGPSAKEDMPPKDPDLPEHWDPMLDKKEPYTLVNLEPDGEEYGEVVLRFFQSMTDGKFEVLNVYRLQNAIQWKYYTVKKTEMLQDNEGFGGIEERQLFHGTSSSVVEAICKKGFDWRLCGKHGTLYGEGSYFAVNASYSHQYTDAKRPKKIRPRKTLTSSSTFLYNPLTVNFSQQPSQITPIMSYTLYAQNALNLSRKNVKTSNPLMPMSATDLSVAGNQQSQAQRYKVVPKPAMIQQLTGFPGAIDTSDDGERNTAKLFLARVLVGKYVGGSSRLRKPPPLCPKLDPFGKCYDSCVDNINFPTIFVIFESAQAYPEYLVEYSYE